MKVELLSCTPNMEELIEQAGRVCYRSHGNGETGNLIRKLVRRGHTSVLEHGSFTFMISDITRVCSHQLVRHRIASFSQESQRYVKQASDDKHPGWQMYRDALANGVAPEDARYMLPQSCKTRLVMTMNCRALLNFFELRLASGAQAEIRGVAYEMLRYCIVKAPHIFEGVK